MAALSSLSARMRFLYVCVSEWFLCILWTSRNVAANCQMIQRRRKKREKGIERVREREREKLLQEIGMTHVVTNTKRYCRSQLHDVSSISGTHTNLQYTSIRALKIYFFFLWRFTLVVFRSTFHTQIWQNKKSTQLASKSYDWERQIITINAYFIHVRQIELKLKLPANQKHRSSFEKTIVERKPTYQTPIKLQKQSIVFGIGFFFYILILCARSSVLSLAESVACFSSARVCVCLCVLCVCVPSYVPGHRRH